MEADQAIARSAAHGDASSASSAPPALAAPLHAAIARDFATATEAVLYGMAIALGVCFLVALRYPTHRHQRAAHDPAPTVADAGSAPGIDTLAPDPAS